MAPRRGRRRALTLVKTPPAPRYFTKDSDHVFNRCSLELARVLGRQAAREFFMRTNQQRGR
jgi:hypothetical protein